VDRNPEKNCMKLDLIEFEFRECTESDIDDIMAVQEDAFLHLENPELLRRNSREMLLECLSKPHYTVGAYYKGELAAFSVLYYPYTDAENLAVNLEGVDYTGMRHANYKLCIVKHEYIGNSLQRHLANKLLERAIADGVNIVCATASPENIYSIRNIEKLGFKYNRTLEKYGYSRNLYYKVL